MPYFHCREYGENELRIENNAISGHICLALCSSLQDRRKCFKLFKTYRLSRERRRMQNNMTQG